MRCMRLLIMFDLPTSSAIERKSYAKFRKFLLEDGFQMEQFSVYTRPCLGLDSTDTHLGRLRANLPETGKITALVLTEKQYEDRKTLVCSSCYENKTIDIGSQMTLFL